MKMVFIGSSEARVQPRKCSIHTKQVCKITHLVVYVAVCVRVCVCENRCCIYQDVKEKERASKPRKRGVAVFSWLPSEAGPPIVVKLKSMTDYGFASGNINLIDDI